MQNTTITFKDLSISEKVLAVLEKNSFITPTPIQEKVIPLGITGKDIIGIAQTGTGKTLGFGVPMIERILANPDGRGLIILPTRELAIQVDETIRKIGYELGIRTAVLIGGDSMFRQVKAIKNGPDIVIATPGRLIDHLQQGNIKLDRVTTLVLDEADHMFDIGFAPQIKEIMKKVPKNRQTLLFSATMPHEIATLAVEHMQLPLRIEMAPAGTSSANVEQEIIVVSRGSKFNLLVKLLGETDPGRPVLVFSRTKHGAKDIAHDLRNIGITAVEIHSNRTLGQRREALEGFKKHTYRVLVATDIAARGIDVKDIGLVVNYDLPEQTADYVHRIGRTGRGGKFGKAVSFATPDQKYDILAIERLIKKTITTKSHEGAVMGARAEKRPSYRGGFRRSSSRPSYGSRGGSSFGGRSSYTPRTGSTGPRTGSAPRGDSAPRSGFGPRPSMGARPGGFRRSSPRTGSTSSRGGYAPRSGSTSPRSGSIGGTSSFRTGGFRRSR